jgi:hypothetical protein
VAQLEWISGEPKFVNASEKRVVEALARNLPATSVLVPNITIPYPLPNTPEEHDVIVVTEDAVFVVEIKDYAGDLEVTEQHLIKNGEVLSNPHVQSRLKAQKLATRLKERLPWFSSGGWVENVVVLAREPKSLVLDDSMKTRIVRLEELFTILGGRSPLIRPQFHGQLAGRGGEVVEAITGGSRPRDKHVTFGRFRGVTRVLETEQFSVWKGSSILTGEEVVLEVNERPLKFTSQSPVAWKSSKLVHHDLVRQIGVSADLDGPREAFELDNGSIVTVWPRREEPLASFVAKKIEADEKLAPEVARRIVAGYASALLHLHSNGWVLGQPASHNVVVRSNGRGAFVVGGGSPSSGVDTSVDLRYLGTLVETVRRVCDDSVLNKFAKDLAVEDANDLPSLAFVLLALEDPATLKAEQHGRSAGPLARFTIEKALADHPYGRTALALDQTLAKRVVLKYESGRPDGDWTLREYRVLSHPRLASNPGVVRTLSGNTEDGFSHLATEYVEAPNLASLVDAGVYSSPSQIREFAVRLLGVVQQFHPDIAAILTLLDEAGGELDEGQTERLGELRGGGVAHNLLEPSNIYVDDARGPVLVDFTRAGRFGEIIPDRRPEFWPPDLPMTVSDPRADLFAIGSIIRLMTEHPATKARTSTATEQKILEQLEEIARRATSEDPSRRFVDATQFIDAFGVTTSVALPEPPVDVWKIQQRLDELVGSLRFDEALELCPPEWEETRAAIERKRRLVAVKGTLLLDIDGVTLSHIGRIEIPPGVTGRNVPHDGGEAEVYVVSEPGGGHFEVRVRSATVDGVRDEWVGIEQAVGEPARMQHAVRSLRMNVQMETSGMRWIELSQALLKKNPEHPNQASGKKASEAMLQSALASEYVGSILSRFGAKAFGTRETILSDTSKRRNYLAVMYGDSLHMPAVAHFVCRIMPLYRGLEAG